MADNLKSTLPGATQDEQIIGMVRANAKESDAYLQTSGYKDEQAEWNDLYRGVPEKKPYKWMSNKFIPLVMSKVDSALANLMDILFQVKPPVAVKPRPYGKGDEFHAGIIKTLLSKQITTDNFFMKMLQYIKNLLIYGTAIGVTSWQKNYRNVYRRVPVYERLIDYFGNDVTEIVPATRRLIQGYEKKRVTLADEGPCFEPCNIGDIFPDPQAIEVTDSWVIWRRIETIACLRANRKSKENPAGMYNDEVLKLNASDSFEKREGKDDIEGSMGRQQIFNVTREDLSTRVEVFYWFGPFDINEDGVQEQCIFALAADKYLIRKEENPYWHGEVPLIKGGYNIVPNEFYHIGIPEAVCDIQHNINETVNQRIDNITLILNSVMKVVKDSGVKIKDMVIAPGKPMLMDEKGAVEFDRPPDVTQSNFMHVADLERWAQEVSVPKITMGIGGGGQNSTATGMSILAQGAEDKSMLSAKIVENTSFNRILRLFYEMDYQFLDEYKVAELLNMDPSLIDWEKMRPEDYDIEPAGVKVMGDRNQKALKILQLLNVVGDDPNVRKDELIRKLVELMSITDNPMEIMRTKEEVAQILAQRQQEMIAQQMTMAIMGAKMAGSGAGRESTQFQGGETNLSSPGVPPNTAAAPPDSSVNMP